MLQRDNGIDARRLAVDSLDEVFTIDPNTLARRFAAHAPKLAARAATRALAAPGWTASLAVADVLEWAAAVTPCSCCGRPRRRAGSGGGPSPTT